MSSDAAPRWLLAYVAFVIYGSLVPLEFQALPLSEAWQRFQRIEYLALGVESRADWVANGVLYLPLGFLAARALRRPLASWPTAAIAALTLGCTTAIAIEFAQLFFPARTVSQNDLIAEFAGAALGAMLAPFATGWALRIAQAWSGGGARLWLRLLELYALGYLALCFFPYDLLLSRPELQEKAASDLWGWLFAPTERGRFIVVLQLCVEVAVTMPLGLWLAQRRTGASAVARAAAAGFFLGAAIELGQFFIASGVSQGASLATRALGMALGVAVAPHLAHSGIDLVRRLLRRHGAWLWLAYVPVLLVASGWLRLPWQGADAARKTLAELHWLPLYYHYYTTEALALISLCSVALMYAPMTALAWARGMSTAATLLLVAASCAAVEASKLFLQAQHPDPSNVFIAAGAAWLLLRLAALAQRAPSLATSAPSAVASDSATADSAIASTPVTNGPQRLVLLAALPLAVLFALLSAASFPAFPWLLTALLLACAAAAAWRPALALAIVPALMPALDLAPWSGRLYWDEFDLLLTVCLAVAWLRTARSTSAARAAATPRITNLLFAVLGLSLLLSTARALWPWPAIDDNSFSSYFSAFNALRIAKGAVWAALFMAVWHRLDDARGSAARMFGTGMVVGLALTVAIVLWERSSFVNLLDFHADYRVTGPFSAMHKGGAYIECYLAVGAAYALAWLLQTRAWPTRALAALLFTASCYAMMVTYSRNGYAALVVVVLLGLALLGAGAHTLARRWLLAGGVVATLAAVVWPIATTGFAQERLAQSGRDWGVRAAHWRDALSLRSDDVLTSLVGMGVGRFPETHFWRSKEAQHAADLRLERDASGPFMRLGAGVPTYVEQIVRFDSTAASLVLTLEIRSTAAAPALNVMFCEKWLLTSGHCEGASLLAKGAAPNTWQRVEASLATRQLVRESGWRTPPVKLALLASSNGAPLDVRALSLRTPQGAELLRNGEWRAGWDHWFFATDVDPPWHIHSLPVAVLFDQGWFGVLAWGVLVLGTLTAGVLRARQGDMVAATALVAACGFLTSALLNTLIDAPRFLWLLLVLLCLCTGRKARAT